MNTTFTATEATNLFIIAGDPHAPRVDALLEILKGEALIVAGLIISPDYPVPGAWKHQEEALRDAAASISKFARPIPVDPQPEKKFLVRIKYEGYVGYLRFARTKEEAIESAKELYADGVESHTAASDTEEILTIEADEIDPGVRQQVN